MSILRIWNVGKDIDEFAETVIAGRQAGQLHQLQYGEGRAGGSSKPTYTTKDTDAPTNTIQLILNEIRDDGDEAVLKWEGTYSKLPAVATVASLRVSKRDVRAAYSRVSEREIDAIRLAKSRLERTESAVMSVLQQDITVDVDGAATLTKRFVPIRSVGCYVPGGLARYPSTVVMSVVPAKIAGVNRIVVMSPPAPATGMPDPLTVVAADICGADEIYTIGGAQAIAALSYGTRTIAKVDKIVGPGGPVVTTAKYLASAYTAIDMQAGPTELGIVADATADARHIALDLISQAEHSKDTMCYLLTTSERLAGNVDEIVSDMIPSIQRGDIVGDSLKNNGFIAVCGSASGMIRLANALAPEHLQVMTRNPRQTASSMTTPGLVLVGGSTPSAASDYLLGSNHVLPTSGFGSTHGSLSVLDFLKVVTQVECPGSSPLLSSTQTRDMECLRALTDAEDLPNHYEAVAGRIHGNNKSGKTAHDGAAGSAGNNNAKKSRSGTSPGDTAKSNNKKARTVKRGRRR